MPWIAVLLGVALAWALGLLVHGLWLTLRGWWRARACRPLTLEVVARDEPAPGLCALTLRRPGGGRLPGFRPGQYLTLLAPQSHGAPPTRRCYSLAAWAGRPRQYELCIKREPGGRVSGWAHMHLVAGARLRVLPPAGRFVLEPPATGTLMLVAAGVGITPLRAMLHALVAQDAPMRTLLLHAARQHDGLCYAAEFERLAREYPWFEYLPILSCPTPAWRGLRGRLNAERVLQYASVADTTLYLCAPRTMIEQLSDGLIGAGVAPQRIQYEHFGVAGAGTGVHRVSVNGRPDFMFRGEPTLLHAFESQGVPLPSECRAGHCGRCRMKLNVGEVRWLLTPQIAIEADEALACCCIPASDLAVEMAETGR